MMQIIYQYIAIGILLAILCLLMGYILSRSPSGRIDRTETSNLDGVIHPADDYGDPNDQDR